MTTEPLPKKQRIQSNLLASFGVFPKKPVDATSPTSTKASGSDTAAVQVATKNPLDPTTAELCALELTTIPADWLATLQDQLEMEYFCALKRFLQKEAEAGRTIFPPDRLIYSWTRYCPFSAIRVVILGQDPYHNDGQAMGLAFSVPAGIQVPPSLKNIYKELSDDIEGFVAPPSGCLTGWAQQGVLLLNTSLTVKAHEPASHAGKGWEILTDAVINKLNQRRSGLVFMLWGSHAQKKSLMIDKKKHLVLAAAHPSPLSAHKGFFGCRHFSKCNQYLQSKGLSAINWNRTMSRPDESNATS